MSLGTVLLIILILLLLGALPTWPYSAGWGYYPSSGLGLVVLLLVILYVLRSTQADAQITSRPSPPAIGWRWGFEVNSR
jgi:Protein of unknown function (DUF3309)